MEMGFLGNMILCVCLCCEFDMPLFGVIVINFFSHSLSPQSGWRDLSHLKTKEGIVQYALTSGLSPIVPFLQVCV